MSANDLEMSPEFRAALIDALVETVLIATVTDQDETRAFMEGRGYDEDDPWIEEAIRVAEYRHLRLIDRIYSDEDIWFAIREHAEIVADSIWEDMKEEDHEEVLASPINRLLGEEVTQ